MRSTNYSVDVDKRWVALMVLFMPLIYSPKSFPHRTRHQCLKLSGHGQISITDDGRPQGIATNFERCRRGLHSMPHTARWILAKSGLEASVRYLAMRLGRSGIRERHLRGRSKCPKQKESPIAADRQIQPHLTGHSRGLTGPPPNKKATLGWLFVGLCKIKAVLSLFRANSP